MATSKPNILIIWGDDIGWFNVSAYNHGVMGYRTPNIDRIAREGAMFTDWYGQQSCTAGRAAFITGQSPIRTGLTKVGLPGANLGLQPDDPTIADVLKPLGYVCGQFGKNHLGDRDEFLPTAHGFDEFFGNLYPACKPSGRPPRARAVRRGGTVARHDDVPQRHRPSSRCERRREDSLRRRALSALRPAPAAHDPLRPGTSSRRRGGGAVEQKSSESRSDSCRRCGGEADVRRHRRTPQHCGDRRSGALRRRMALRADVVREAVAVRPGGLRCLDGSMTQVGRQ
jgi:arylsulfatase A-like enzyme